MGTVGTTACRTSERRIAGDEYLNGTQLAKHLGIGLTTLRRWVAEGKLPKPEKGISGMLLFAKPEALPKLREK